MQKLRNSKFIYFEIPGGSAVLTVIPGVNKKLATFWYTVQEEVQRESTKIGVHPQQDDALETMLWIAWKVAFNHQISRMIFQVATKNSSTGSLLGE